MLREDVASALAADAEATLRDIATTAQSFMRHSRRDTLTAADITAALRLRPEPPSNASSAVSGGAALNHARGYLPRDGVGPGSTIGASAPRYEPVANAPGLFVAPNPMLTLRDVIRAPLPSPDAPPEVEVGWLTFNGSPPPRDANVPLGDLVPQRGGRQIALSHIPKRRRSITRRIDAYLQHVVQILSSAMDDTVESQEFHDILASLSVTAAIHPLLPALISHYHTIVSANVNEGGKTGRLVAATRVLRAVVHNPSFGFEAYVHNVLPALLTTIAGRSLGSGDHVSLRGIAADTLRDILALHGTPLLRSRVAKTFVAVLTGNASELAAMHGAVLGMMALGVDVLQIALLPHVPALQDGLRRVHAAINEAEEALAAAGGDERPRGKDGNVESAKTPSPGAVFVALTRSHANQLEKAVATACSMCAEAGGQFAFSTSKARPNASEGLCAVDLAQVCV